MPAGQGRDDGHGWDEEIFATAVELGHPPEFADDGELSRDLAIVALLRAGGEACAPTAEERGRSRAAVLARVAMESDPSDQLPVPVPDARPVADPTAVLPVIEDEPHDELAALRRNRHRKRPPLGRRIMLVAAAAVLGSAVLGGTGVVASRDAQPGDTLYPVKRLADSAWQQWAQLLGSGNPEAKPCAGVRSGLPADCAPAVDVPAGPDIGDVEPTPPSHPTDTTEASPTDEGDSQPGHADHTETRPSDGDRPDPAPQLLPEPVDKVLHPDDRSPTTTPAAPPDEDDGNGSEGDGSDDGLPPVTVPPLVPGLPGLSVG